MGDAVICRYSALVDGALLKGYALIAQKWHNTALTRCKQLQVIALVLVCRCGMWVLSTPVNIGCVVEVSLAPDYVQRVMGGTTTALSAPYKLPSTITGFFVKGEAAEIEVDVGRTRQV